MEPQRHLAFAIGIGEALAEAELTALDRTAASPALRTPGRGDLECVWHGTRIQQRSLTRGSLCMNMLAHEYLFTTLARLPRPPRDRAAPGDRGACRGRTGSQPERAGGPSAPPG